MENRIRELRAVRSMSQGQLGDLLGVSRQTINAIENGRHDPSLPLAFAISAIFAEPIEAIFSPDVATTGQAASPATGHGEQQLAR